MNVLDDGRRRAFTKPGDEPVEVLPGSLRDTLQGSVGDVRDPAKEAKGVGFLEDEVPKANTVDAPSHADFDSGVAPRVGHRQAARARRGHASASVSSRSSGETLTARSSLPRPRSWSGTIFRRR